MVGQSGSGKHAHEIDIALLAGRRAILIDGYDIDKVELYSLRRQVGIVPRDPLLSSVVTTSPLRIPMQELKTLPGRLKLHAPMNSSWDCHLVTARLGERNEASLVVNTTTAIRTPNPKLLVMDEATSALDYDTERRVCQNLRESLDGCTVFFVTHRLSTVRNADMIVMMHQGAIVEVGSHDELMALQGRYYALLRQQEGG